MSDLSLENDVSPPPAWAMAMVRYRFVLLSILLSISAFALYTALGLQFNFSPDKLFMSGSEEFAHYSETHVPAFGAGDNSVVVAVGGDFNEASHVRAFLELEQKIEAIRGIIFVRSLGDLPSAQGDALDAVAIAKTARREGLSEQDRTVLRAHPIATGLMVNKDLSLATLIIQFDSAWGTDAERSRLVQSIWTLINAFEKEHPHLKAHFAGIPVSSDVVVETLKRDQLRFVPLTVLVMALLLLFAFRSLRAVIYPFMATGCATLWCVAWLVLTEHHVNVVNNAIITLLLVISIADSVHIVARYRAERAKTPSAPNDHVVARTIQAMWIPCLLTTTTTSIGFASALVAKAPLIREFGLDSALGVCFAFFSTFLLVPTGLTLFVSDAKAPKERSSSVEKLLQHTMRFVIAHPLKVALVSALLALTSFALALNVSANQKLIGELPDDDASVQAMKLLERELSGLLPFDVAFAGTPERLREPDVLRALSSLRDFVEAHPIGASARSRADVYTLLSSRLNPEDKRPISSWDDEKIAQLGVLIEMAQQEEGAQKDDAFNSPDQKVTRLMGLAPDVGSEVFAEFRDELQVQVDGLKLPGVEVRLTGAQVIASRALTHIISDMAMSIGVALLVIFIFMSLLFRSFLLSAVALIPNAVPISLTLAAMTLLSIELRVATAIIFSMSLGVAVDSCVHYLMRYREELQQGLSENDALIATGIGAGKPVVYATMLLLAGFAVMGASRFNAIRDFAILSGVTLFSALVIDIVLLPALLILIRKKSS